MPKRVPDKLEDHLLAGRQVNPTTGCWERAERSNGNYTWIGHKWRKYRVHVAAAILWLGYDIDSGLDVCHHCDNGHCFNPEHLFFGTARDNNLDCVRKGRHKGWAPARRLRWR